MAAKSAWPVSMLKDDVIFEHLCHVIVHFITVVNC